MKVTYPDGRVFEGTPEEIRQLEPPAPVQIVWVQPQVLPIAPALPAWPSWQQLPRYPDLTVTC